VTTNDRRQQRINTLVKEGKSANQIQRQLQKEHMGMRRTNLLKAIRQVKGKPQRREYWKYTPKKYRKQYRVISREPQCKRVSVYGTVDGRPRRVQVYGIGRNLYQAMYKVARHPPLNPFLTISAGLLLNHPSRYLDQWERWDSHPRVES